MKSAFIGTRGIPGLFSLFGIAIILYTSCVNCAECRYVTRDKGAIVEEGPWNQYCDEQLTEIESEPSAETGTRVTEWECVY